MLEGCHPAFER